MNIKKISLYFSILFAASLLISHIFMKIGSNANRANIKEYDLIIKNHEFEPKELRVSSGIPFYINVHNQDNTSEEFDSIELKREKIIPGNSKIKIKIGALRPGEYKFIGEFHEETAYGKVIAIQEQKNGR